MPQVSLFGTQYEKTGKIYNKELEQGSLGDNFFITMVSALSEIDGLVPRLFH